MFQVYAHLSPRICYKTCLLILSLLSRTQPATAGASSVQENVFSPNVDLSGPWTSGNQTTHARTTSFPERVVGGVPASDTLLPLDTTHGILYPDGAHQQQQPIDENELFYDIFNDPDFDPAWFDIEPADSYSGTAASCGFITDIPNIIDEVDRQSIVLSTEADASTTPGSGLGFYSDKYANPLSWSGADTPSGL